jgi:hypothetical protein
MECLNSSLKSTCQRRDDDTVALLLMRGQQESSGFLCSRVSIEELI